MAAKFDLEKMLREIEEDEGAGGQGKQELSQEEIRKALRERRKDRTEKGKA